MVRGGGNAVYAQQFGEFLHLFAREAVDDARLVRARFDKADDLFLHVHLGTHFVKEIRAVEGRLEDLGVGHSEVFLDVLLDFGRSGGREGNHRHRGDLVQDGADVAVLGTEVVSPLGDAMRLVDGAEGNGYRAQEVGVFVFGERFGGYVEQFGDSGADVGLDLFDFAFGERGIQHMGYGRLGGNAPHGIHLVFHQGDQRGDDDGRAGHQQSRQLVRQGFSSSGRHDDKSVVTGHQALDNLLLLTFEGVKTEVFF